MSDVNVLERLHRRISNMLGRGRVTLSDDTGPISTLQVDLGPQGPDGPRFMVDKMPVMGLYGHASVPPPEADVFVIFLSGDRQKGAVLGHNHQASRLKGLSPGDSALYDVRGAYVKLTAAGLTIDAAGLPVTIQNASAINITTSGAVHVTAATAVLTCPSIDLGATGGHAVARVGDTVVGGVITSGSSKVRAA